MNWWLEFDDNMELCDGGKTSLLNIYLKIASSKTSGQEKQ